MPKEIGTLAEFDAFLNENTKVVVDFTATWCGPCKMIGPIFAKLEPSYENIKFIKVDVDENDGAASKCGISAMPTFQLFINGQKVDEVIGASQEKLETMLKKHN